MKKKYKLLVFDVDGTLVDTDDVVIKTWQELLVKLNYNLNEYSNEFLRGFSGPPLDDSLKKMFPNLELEYTKKLYENITRKYYDSDIHIFANSKEVIDRLKSEGYKLAIFTSKNKEMTLYTLKISGFANYFDLIISRDDVINPKPNIEGLLKIRDFFNINLDDILYIGDSKFDYLTSLNAKIDCILLTILPRKFDNNIKPKAFINSYVDLYKEITNGNY